MIFRQIQHKESSTFTYLVASDYGREALIIDPVDDSIELYTKLIDELGCRLVMAVDTHTHADHVSARCALRHSKGCHAVIGEHSKAECASLFLKDGERFNLDGTSVESLYTPGHTDDSYSLLIGDRVFTGDALFIRGCGRTDFQQGDAGALYDSITQKLFTLPEETMVYPAHDYNGRTSSSIYEEKRYNPRLAGKSKGEFIEIMESLNLPRPAKMDVAVPANLVCHG